MKIIRRIDIRRISRDERGAIELPYKILIIVILLLITVPMVLSSFNRFSSTREKTQLLTEIGKLESAMVMVYFQGENASLVVEVDIPSCVENVCLGDRLVSTTGSFWRSWAIYYTIKGESEMRVPVEATNKPVPITNGTLNAGLELGPGTSKILLTKLYNTEIEENYIMATYLGN